MSLLASTALAALLTVAPAVAASATPHGTAQGNGDALGFTVSWTPTTTPVSIAPGTTATGRFWVTNRTDTALPFTVIPATAVPGDNGTLSTVQRPDPRFAHIALSITHFVAQPHQTQQVDVAVTAPRTLGPGVYLVPAIVRPEPRAVPQSIRIQQQAVALATFQVQGPVDARMSATFVPPTGVVERQIPGLPPIQLTDTGQQSLRVLSRSSSSLYSYYEVVANQPLFGTPTVIGHIPGDPGDLRAPPSLYFPDHARSYPIRWRPSGIGIGLTTLTAYVSYHPTPTTTGQIHDSISILTISPLWLLAFIALLVFTGIRPRRDTPPPHDDSRRAARRRQRFQPASSRRRGILTGVLTLGTVFTALLGAALPFALLAAAAAACAAAHGSERVRRSFACSVAIRTAAGVASIGATILIVLTATAALSPQIAAAAAAGAGTWALLALWSPAPARPARRVRQTMRHRPVTAATPVVGR